MTLTDKMAKSPEAVTSFLDALAKENAPRAQGELQELLALKQSDARAGNFPQALNAWDRDYYTSQLMSSLRSKARHPDFLAAYFSLGTVMQGPLALVPPLVRHPARAARDAAGRDVEPRCAALRRGG